MTSRFGVLVLGCGHIVHIVKMYFYFENIFLYDPGVGTLNCSRTCPHHSEKLLLYFLQSLSPICWITVSSMDSICKSDSDVIVNDPFRTVLLAIHVCNRDPTWASVPGVTVTDTRQIATQSPDPAG